MDGVYGYVGSELGLFAQAVNWKRYLQRQLAAFIKGRVLEVGAGIGGSTRFLYTSDRMQWTCLEPDYRLAEQIIPEMAKASPACAGAVNVVVGTIATLGEVSQYDTILYVDVLEHIERDAFEVQQAARLLAQGGHLIVISPAHQWLFSAFDQAVGHYRRYSRAALQTLMPQGLILRRARYLDSVGLFASLANRFVLKSPVPSTRELRFWDSLMVPVSRLLDPALCYRVGKSVYAVWQRPAAG
jgi:2-polyprenyl-3-methyl-5-hydroxy-6-metoxy-1,4-benzoquinol methylase